MLVPLCLWLLRSKQHTYDDVVGKLAEELNLEDPSKLRLTAHNCYSQQPKPPAIRYRGVDCLADMLTHHNQVCGRQIFSLWVAT